MTIVEHRQNGSVAKTTYITEKTNSDLLRVLLLDDDPLFIRHFSSAARKKGVFVKSCKSSRDFLRQYKHGNFDIAVIDYNLNEGATGTDVARTINDLPVLLVSQSSKWTRDNNSWPLSVRAFINKKYGVDKILETSKDIGIKNKNI